MDGLGFIFNYWGGQGEVDDGEGEGRLQLGGMIKGGDKSDGFEGTQVAWFLTGDICVVMLMMEE